MSVRFVPKSVTLNDLERRNWPLTLRYVTDIGKHVFEHITASARTELIDQKLASVTQRAVKFACVAKKHALESGHEA